MGRANYSNMIADGLYTTTYLISAPSESLPWPSHELTSEGFSSFIFALKLTLNNDSSHLPNRNSYVASYLNPRQKSSNCCKVIV